MADDSENGESGNATIITFMTCAVTLVVMYTSLGFFAVGNVDYYFQTYGWKVALAGIVLVFHLEIHNVFSVVGDIPYDHTLADSNFFRLVVLPWLEQIYSDYLQISSLGGAKKIRMLLEDTLVVYLCHLFLHQCLGFYRRYILQLIISPHLLKRKISHTAIEWQIRILKCIPKYQKQMQAGSEKMKLNMEHALNKHNLKDRNLVLPPNGMADEELLKFLENTAQKENQKWKDGFVSGAVYHGGEDHLKLLDQAYSLFNVSNPLHSDLWPTIMKMESEVIAMTASLLNGGDTDVCGAITSGGTESIILAAKTHRDWFRAKRGITKPEIIAGVTAHAAIDKACSIMGITLVTVPVDEETFQVNLQAVQWNINANTIMIYSSAPNFPQGTIDDITGLSELAQRYQVGLHVDACLGGFVLPFCRKLGHDIPPFDFTCPGVTSMSVDTHKYGYSAKGTSVVLYRHKDIRKFQYFSFPDWTGGLYITPTIAGSRPGGLSACCWTSLMRLGEQGFLERTQEILTVAKRIKEGIDAMEGLHVLGDPKAMVICFGSRDFNILRVGDLMSQKGWSLNALQRPPCLHICVTLRHVDMAERFLEDLNSCAKHFLTNPEEAAKVNGNETSGIYGLAASLPAGPVNDMLTEYTNITLQA